MIKQRRKIVIKLVGQNFLKKHRKYLYQPFINKQVSVVSQIGNIIKLSDNSEYDYFKAFSTDTLTALDKDLQRKIKNEIFEQEKNLKEQNRH